MCGVPEALGQRVAFVLAAGGKHDFSALFDEQFGGPQANPAGGAGDDRDVVVESSGHGGSLFVIDLAGF